MERFVRLVVAGGLALLAGLWAVALAAAPSPPWVVGAALVAAGSVALGAGILTELEGWRESS